MSAINYKNIEHAIKTTLNKDPFNYCIINNFFKPETATQLEKDFLPYASKNWFVYTNLLENKKTINDWNLFPPTTYKIFTELNSSKFIKMLERNLKTKLFADFGLHGGGWHIHGKGGNLNPHLDYSIHPKNHLQRKLNLIIYLSKNFLPSKHKGHLGFWAKNTSNNNIPGELKVEIEPIFNRAVIFDTSQYSWHGISQKLDLPSNIYRKSIAVYYLEHPEKICRTNEKAIFAPRINETNNIELLEEIKLRQDKKKYAQAYIVRKAKK